MTKEYDLRRSKADEINEKISDLTIGILLVGSVSYNPQAVTSDSDLDLIGVIDFKNTDFKELYKRLDQTYEPLLAKYANSGNINNVSIVWDTPQFEVGLHLWDKNAFERVINLYEYNYIFRRNYFGRDFKSTADVETLKNLKGEKKELYKDPVEVEGGHVLKFYSYFEDNSDIYLGIQSNNLLLNPSVISEQESFLSNGIQKFENNVREKLKSYYGSSTPETNLYNSLQSKLQNKITEELRKKLENFF